MILLDTSILIDALTGPRRSAPSLRKAIERGERVLVPALVLYEWLRGPRLKAELLAQESLFPRTDSVPFGPEECALAATLYRKVSHPRGREIDLAIAACAIARAAYLWTLNASDFRDVPDLRLWSVS
ncbi:MAG TPA: type II toxin-antitoxin system VapC family toxin [Acidobacteriota bacterium]|jgi:predicted nucleic acid-binding protein